MRTLLLAALVTHCACAREPCDEPRSCPEEETINCMPVVPEQYADLCASECRDWVQENCPGVAYVD